MRSLRVMFDEWLAHFRDNPARQRAIEAAVAWGSPTSVSGKPRRAFVRSFQRFELGESGEGERLLSKARQAGDPVYLAALTLLIEEEQKHSALFHRGLEHLAAPRLDSHWSDRVFTLLRRALGLRTELALFLIAETVAMPYFAALEESAPDPVLRGIGRRIANDERNHIRFQVDRLYPAFSDTPVLMRIGVGMTWAVVAVGAATTVVVDHGAALASCGVRRGTYFRAALRHFGIAARAVLGSGERPPLGPLASGTTSREFVGSSSGTW